MSEQDGALGSKRVFQDPGGEAATQQVGYPDSLMLPPSHGLRHHPQVCPCVKGHCSAIPRETRAFLRGPGIPNRQQALCCPVLGWPDALQRLGTDSPTTPGHSPRGRVLGLSCFHPSDLIPLSILGHPGHPQRHRSMSRWSLLSTLWVRISPIFTRFCER